MGRCRSLVHFIVFFRKTTNDHGHNFLAFGRQSSSSDRESFVPYVFFLSLKLFKLLKVIKHDATCFQSWLSFHPLHLFRFCDYYAEGRKLCSMLKTKSVVISLAPLWIALKLELDFYSRKKERLSHKVKVCTTLIQW